MNNKKTNGFYIPTGLAKQSKLTKQTGKDKGKQVNFEWHTKAVYSIYHYFTFNCDGLGYCTITAEEVANRLGMSLRTVRYCRQLLKECNYISTDGGIKTTALIEYKEGCTDCHHNKEIMGAQIVTVEEKESAEGCTDCQQGVHRLSTEGAQIVTDGCTDCHHNKERIKKNKEVIKNTCISKSSIDNVTVTADVEDLPFPNTSNEVEVESVEGVPSQRSTRGLNDKLCQRLEGLTGEEIDREFNKFLQSIEKGDFDGGERNRYGDSVKALKCLSTFQHFNSSKAESYRTAYDRTNHVRKANSELSKYNDGWSPEDPFNENGSKEQQEEQARQRRQSNAEQLTKDFFKLLDNGKTEPTADELTAIYNRLQTDELSDTDRTRLKRIFNDTLQECNIAHPLTVNAA